MGHPAAAGLHIAYVATLARFGGEYDLGRARNPECCGVRPLSTT
jgi:hypothetical protein